MTEKELLTHGFHKSAYRHTYKKKTKRWCVTVTLWDVGESTVSIETNRKYPYLVFGFDTDSLDKVIKMERLAKYFIRSERKILKPRQQ